MKTLRLLSLLIAPSAVAVALASLVGCASPGNYKKGSSAAAGLTESADKVASGKIKIDTALNTLNDLVNNTQGDLVPRFKKFNDAVSDIQTTAEHVKASVATMRDEGNEYFKAWDQQLASIKNEDIKNRSADRKKVMQQKFTEIKRSYVMTGDTFRPFMSNLRDIQTALNTDLTPGGLAAIKGAAGQAGQDAVPLKASIDQLAGHFKDLGAAMAAAGTPESAPPK